MLAWFFVVSPISNQDQIVAMDHFRLVDVAEYAFDFVGRLAGDQAGFAAAVVGQAANK